MPKMPDVVAAAIRNRAASFRRIADEAEARAAEQRAFAELLIEAATAVELEAIEPALALKTAFPPTGFPPFLTSLADEKAALYQALYEVTGFAKF